MALAPPVGERVAALLDRVLAELHTPPEEPGHLLHGDFKCDNILVHHERRACSTSTGSRPVTPPWTGVSTADLRWWTRSGGVDAGPSSCRPSSRGTAPALAPGDVVPTSTT